MKDRKMRGRLWRGSREGGRWRALVRIYVSGFSGTFDGMGSGVGNWVGFLEMELDGRWKERAGDV